jgi:hypothetical protein
MKFTKHRESVIEALDADLVEIKNAKPMVYAVVQVVLKCLKKMNQAINVSILKEQNN